MDMAPFYNAGYDSHNRGEKYSNPHPIGSTKFDWYERGFMQALKRSTRRLRLSNPDRSWSFQLLRDAERHMKSITGRCPK